MALWMHFARGLTVVIQGGSSGSCEESASLDAYEQREGIEDIPRCAREAAQGPKDSRGRRKDAGRRLRHRSEKCQEQVSSCPSHLLSQCRRRGERAKTWSVTRWRHYDSWSAERLGLDGGIAHEVGLDRRVYRGYERRDRRNLARRPERNAN